ncbi:SRPBCC family protein [Streptomyces sp. NPDC052225]|uniref:SRPBCC family protein n=1 Tax=Streptomyces sp. NPDC052225 TaxID=3154949 RepID=UPI0034365C9F
MPVDDIHWPSGFSPDQAHGYCRAEALVHAPPARVFALLGDTARWADWVPGVTRVRAGPLDGALDVVFLGRSFEVYVGEREPPRRLGWSGVGAGVQSYRAWLLTPVGADTHVLTAIVVRGPATGAVRTVSDRWARRLNARWVARLKSLAENGSQGDVDRTSRDGI